MKKTMTKNIISLRMGDWSNDGHCISEVVTIEANLTHKELKSAYEKGVKKVGFNVTDDVANAYEEPYMTVEQWRLLEKAGMTLEQLFDGDKVDIDEAKSHISSDFEDAMFNVHMDAFVNAWLFIAKKGNPKLVYKVVEDKDPIINIGGYGLFS